MEDIRTGWLIKSPGARYINILKGKVQFPVKAKWRKRYFRLHQRTTEKGSTYLKLSYYLDESLQKKKGSIKLKDCMKIQSSLDSSCYQHLFALQTCARGNRVYYLASDTEKDMMEWVSCLCQLCELHNDPLSVDTISKSSSEVESDDKLVNMRKEGAEALTKTRSSSSVEGDCNADDYDIPPNPVPTLTQHLQSTSEYDNDDNQNDYENAEGILAAQQSNDAYNRYRYSEEYEVVTSMNLAAPPPRPPKSSRSEEEEEKNYANVASTQSIAQSTNQSAPHGNRSLDSLYDIPKSLVTAPPPCLGPNTRLHKYINASTKLIDSEGNQISPSDIINQPVKPPRNTYDLSHGYTPMDMPGYTVMDSRERQQVVDTPTAQPRASQANYMRRTSKALVTQHSASSDTSGLSNITGEMEAVKISYSSRTKSYIRESSYIEDMMNNDDISLRHRARTQLLDVSSSDDTDSTSESEQIYDVPPKRPPHIQDVNRSVTKPADLQDLPTPPQAVSRSFRPNAAPRSLPRGQSTVDYVELEHDPLVPRPPIRNNSQNAQSSVEYSELDPVKTAAVKSSGSRTGGD